MKRIFAAIDIADTARSEVLTYIDNLRREFLGFRVAWERAEKLHLTLKFFGAVDEKDLEKIIEAAAHTAKDFSPFDLQIAGTGAFPSRRNARVLWVGIKDKSGNLRHLKKRFEKECATGKFFREKRFFKPHLTVARLCEPRFSYELVKEHSQNNFISASFSVSQIVIYESLLQKSGSIYRRIHSLKFKVD